MENNNQSQSNYRLKPLPAVFILFQIVLVLLLAFSVPKLFQNDKITDTPSEGLSAKITNASSAIPEEYSDWTKMIEWALLNTITENNGNEKLFENQASAKIREDSIRTQYFADDSTNYVRAIVDIPEYKQSYEVFLIYPDNQNSVNMVEYSNPDIEKPYSILCLKEKADVIYPGFECQDSPDYSTRQKIAAKALALFDFDYFSVYPDPSDPNKIIINPSVTYENSEAVKAKYIKETKNAIESLGISPEIFNYYVLTTDDAEYYE